MNRSPRQFEVIQILGSANVPVTVQAIADELEVTKRTIHRDIAALQAMRCRSMPGVGIGYVMRSGSNLPPDCWKMAASSP